MKPLLLLTTLALVVTGAGAAPLERNLVAADAVWVAHLDVDAFKRTAIGAQVLSEMEKPAAQNKLGALQAVFNFDPRTDVSSLTLYGTSNQPQDGVLIVQGTFDAERLVIIAQAAADYQSSKHRSHVLHQWTDTNKKKQGRADAQTVASLHGKLVVFGQTRAAVTRALDVLDAVSANLSGTDQFQELAVSSPTFLQAATRKLEVPEGQPHSALLRQAHSLSLTAGESAGRMRLQLSAQASSAEVAQNMKQIGDGLIALVSMQTDNPAQVALAKASQFQTSGDRLTATMSLPATNVVQWMQAAQARKARE